MTGVYMRLYAQGSEILGQSKRCDFSELTPIFFRVLGVHNLLISVAQSIRKCQNTLVSKWANRKIVLIKFVLLFYD